MGDRVLYFGHQKTTGTSAEQRAGNTTNTGFRVPVLAAKAGGTYDEDTGRLKKSGWRGADGLPEGTIPTNLPFPGVLYGRAIVPPGDNDGYIGPFTWEEAVRIHWGIREIEVTGNPGSGSATATVSCVGAATATFSSGFTQKDDEDYELPDGTELDLIRLLHPTVSVKRPLFEGGENTDRYESDPADPWFMIGHGGQAQAGNDTGIIYATIYVNNIAYDVDDDSFWFLAYAYLYLRYSADATGWAFTPSYGYAGASSSAEATFSTPYKVPKPEDTEDPTWTYEDISEDVTFSFGAIGTRTITLHGIRSVYSEEYAEGVGSASAEASVSVGSLSVEVTKWWQYGNSQGLPIWSETTGAKLRDPAS
jgi:hypothetical protein